MNLSHTEYSFNLYTCHLGTRTRAARNPFSGKTVEFPIDDGMTHEESKALAKSMVGFVASEISGQGYQLLIPPDDAVRLHGEIGDGATSFTVDLVVRSLSDQHLDLILIARAGNFVLTNCTGRDVRLLLPPANDRLKQRWPDAEVVVSRADLRTWLIDVIKGRRVSRS